MKKTHVIQSAGPLTITIPVNQNLDKVVFTSDLGSVEFSREHLQELIEESQEETDNEKEAKRRQV